MTGNIPEHYFLYADDDPDDQLLFKEIVQKVGPHYAVVVCNQGHELMQFLEKLQPDQHLPCCIVLDINMPVWDGFHTLKAIKSHKKFCNLPVVMFTTSCADRDARLCKELGADRYLLKPTTREDFLKAESVFAAYGNHRLHRSE